MFVVVVQPPLEIVCYRCEIALMVLVYMIDVFHLFFGDGKYNQPDVKTALIRLILHINTVFWFGFNPKNILPESIIIPKG